MTVPMGPFGGMGGMGGGSGELGGPAGYSYAAVLVRMPDIGEVRSAVLPTLARIRFSGWVAPPEQGWAVLIPSGVGTVAAGRRGVVGIAEELAAATRATTIAVRVLQDRQLAVVAWESAGEVARFVSDPSREPGAPEDVLPDPVGGENVAALAAACGRLEAGEQLEELLGEALDPDDEIESERLARVLRLLGLPAWLVSAWRLPRPVAIGPSRRQLLRLGAGRAGALGRLYGAAVAPLRRRRPPPPILLDPPRGAGDLDDPALWF